MITENKEKVVVVGGGAAGCMAAIMAAKCGQKVILLEKNEKIGKKIYITGKGRCNVTNATDIDEFLKNIPCNSKFLYGALHALTSRQLMAFFEEAGCALKIERGNRVFPVSDRSSDILKTLEKEMLKRGVLIRKNTVVKDLLLEDLKIPVVVKEKILSEDDNLNQKRKQILKGKRIRGVRLQTGEEIQASKVILALGGLAYPATGSTGDGYKLAISAGHTLEETTPGLVPLETVELDFAELTPLLLKNVGFTVKQGKKTLFNERGEVQFTRFGLSGALVLSASSYLPKRIDQDIIAIIDLKPALNKEQLDNRILKEIAIQPNKTIVEALASFLPRKMFELMLKRCQIDPFKKAGEMSKKERNALIVGLKFLNFQVKAVRGMKEAIITRGGIKVQEIEPKTMASKLVEGLYITGEMLDVDALTGGFNLQIAFSTGYLAGIQPLSEK